MADDTLDWNRVEELFPSLLDEPAAARGAFLDRHCAGAPALRRELESLLAAARSSHTLDLPPALAPGAAGAAPVAGFSGGERLGPWRVDSLIGRGGMGEVWLATRADGAFEQTVAIKLLRSDAIGQ